MKQHRESRRLLALTTQLDGVEQRFPLRKGRYRLGSLPSSSIVLDQVGVSRHHAVLTVNDRNIFLEDLASKNGTYINGRRIERETVTIGDQIAFGPVVLELKESNNLDAELGIQLEQRPGIHTTTANRDTATTSRLSSYETARRWLSIIETFASGFRFRDTNSFGALLEVLVDNLEAQGACWLEQKPEQKPVIVACHGQFTADSLESIAETDWSHSANPQISNLQLEEEPLVAARVATDEALFILVIWGRPPFLGCWDPLLITLMRLARTWLSSEPEPAAAMPRESPKLNFPPGYVVGKSPRMQNLYRQLEAAVQSRAPVLILGETGTGKEEIARILHRSNRGRNGSFVALNCAALPAELLEAELFGIGDRVATGVGARQGKFQLAEDGTLFLDEIGDMAPALQAKLLRALETKEIEPLGRSPIRIDVRVLAATNTDLEKKIKAGSFRADLFYRLAGFVVSLPTLAERQHDIPQLIEHFLNLAASEADKSIWGITVAALNRLLQRPWQGNVRELRHVVQRLVYFCPSHQAIDLALLESIEEHGNLTPSTENQDETAPSKSPKVANEESPPLHLKSLESLRLVEIEKRLIDEALSRTDGNKTRAAELLGISREALRRRLNR